MEKKSSINATSKKKGRSGTGKKVEQKGKKSTAKPAKSKETPKIKSPKKSKATAKTAAKSAGKIAATKKKSVQRGDPGSANSQLVSDKSREKTVQGQDTLTDESGLSQPAVDIQKQGPIDYVMQFIAAGFVLLMMVVVGASYSNMKKYYIKTADGAVEIWKGNFAPLGMELFLNLPEMQPPVSIKPAYRKNEVFPLIFHYYMERADSLLSVSNVPDFEQIKTYLSIALSYATTEPLYNAAIRRLNNIDLMLLLYRAEVAASKGTLAALKKAKRYPDKAAVLKLDQAQTKMVHLKTETISNLIAALKAKKNKALKNPAKKS